MFSFYLNQAICLFAQATVQAERQVDLHQLRNAAQKTIEETIIQLTIAAVLFVVGLYIILKIRKNMLKHALETNDIRLNEFRRMYDAGELSKEEYRAIKLFLADSLTGSETESRSSQVPLKQKKTGQESSREEILKNLLDSEEKN